VNSTGAFAGRRNRKPQGEILTDLREHGKLWEAVPLTAIRSRVQVRMLVPKAAFWRHYPIGSRHLRLRCLPRFAMLPLTEEVANQAHCFLHLRTGHWPALICDG
jgi:hypothetical protein